MMKKWKSQAGICFFLALVPLGGWAQQPYPSKPVRIVVPFSPGTTTDIVARLLAEKAGKALKASFIVENKPGANGLVAARELVRAPKDGYTITVSTNSAHAANAYLYKNLGYDPIEDFSPITGLTRNPHVLVVRAELPIFNMKDLINYGKNNPGKMNFGYGNTGSVVNAAMMQELGEFSAVNVPYKSQPAVVNDMLGGRVDFLSAEYLIVGPHIKSGKLRPIAVTSKKRLDMLPEVPAVAEMFPDYEMLGWVAAFAPAGTPAKIIAQLNRTFVQVSQTPEFQRYLDNEAILSFSTSPEQLGAFQRSEVRKWAIALEKAGVPRE